MNWSDWVPQDNILSSIRDVLQEALIPDSEIQRNVQEKIHIIESLNDFTNYLLFIMGNPVFGEDVRSLSGILLKNNIAAIYATLTEEQILKLRQECLRLIRDPSREVRCSVSNVIIVICSQSLKDWPDLIPMLLKLFANQDEISETALTTLYKICEEAVNSQKSQDEMFRITKEVFPKFVEYATNDKCIIRQDIVKLTNQFLKEFYPIMKQSIDLQLYLNKIIELANADDPELLKYVCHTFVIYIDHQEESLLPHLHDVILYLMEKSQHEDSEVALQASEFWLSTSKLNSCKEILSPYIDKLLPVLLKNMKYSQMELNALRETVGKDFRCEDLAKDVCPFHLRGEQYSDEEEENLGLNLGDAGAEIDDFYMGWTLRKCSAASLDSIAVKFGDDILSLLIPFLNELLNHQDYVIKESAILALGAIAEGCLNGLKPHLPYLMEYLINCMNDEHSLIRVITCWTLSRYVDWIINVDSCPDLYFVPVMTTLLKHFVDENKRVQRAAISAFCIFQEHAQMKLLPYIDFILDGFQVGFQKFHCRSLYLLYDAIGVLAQSVGNHLSRREHVMKLMPLLMQKFVECDNYYDDNFIAVLDCLSNLIPALELSFLPYSEVVYWHCLEIINESVSAIFRYEAHSSDFDPPDKEAMTVAHDVLYNMACGLGCHFVKYVTNSNLLLLLHKTMQDDFNLLRQTAIGLYGELIVLCFPYLANSLNDYLPIIIKNLDESYDGVCSNAAWVIGKLCLVASSVLTSHVPELASILQNLIRNPIIGRTMHKNVALILCILYFVFDIPDLSLETVKNCCILIRTSRDTEEKDLAYRGLCKFITKHPEFLKNNFVYFCDAIASWDKIVFDLKEIIKKIMLSFHEEVGEDQWQQIYSQFPDLLQVKLFSLYGI